MALNLTSKFSDLCPLIWKFEKELRRKVSPFLISAQVKVVITLHLHMDSNLEGFGIYEAPRTIKRIAKLENVGPISIYAWVISYSKCSNWRQISKLLSNFRCLFTFCYLDGANTIKTDLHICNLWTGQFVSYKSNLVFNKFAQAE